MTPSRQDRHLVTSLQRSTPRQVSRGWGTRLGEQRECDGVGNVLGMGGSPLNAAPASQVVSTQSLEGGWGCSQGPGDSLPRDRFGWGVRIPPGLRRGCFSSSQTGMMGAEGRGDGVLKERMLEGNGMLKGRWGAQRKGAGGHGGL